MLLVRLYGCLFSMVFFNQQQMEKVLIGNLEKFIGIASMSLMKNTKRIKAEALSSNISVPVIC